MAPALCGPPEPSVASANTNPNAPTNTNPGTTPTPTATTTPTSTPHISSLEPTSGSIEGGRQVIVRGSNFAQGDVIKFDGVNAHSVNPDNSNDSSIAVKTPEHEQGLVDVTLWRGDDLRPADLRGVHHQHHQPEHLALHDRAGGTPVRITGTDFTDVKSVTFGGVAAQEPVIANATITTKAPSGVPGTPGKVDPAALCDG